MPGEASADDSFEITSNTWEHLHCRKDLFFEWLKSLGKIEKLKDGCYHLIRHVGLTQSYGCTLSVEEKDNIISRVQCQYEEVISKLARQWRRLADASEAQRIVE